jgi:hypothetical protein
MLKTSPLTHDDALAAIDDIENVEVREIVLALIKHRLRISHPTYYRKVNDGFDPEALEVIQDILTRWTGNDAPVL